jgi:PilZ domain
MVEEEKRVAARRKVLKAAKIITVDMKSVLDCTIRDMSETGAKLNVEVSSAIPAEFYFYLISDNSMRDAKTVWRRAGQIGVHFTSEPKPAPASLKSLSR